MWGVSTGHGAVGCIVPCAWGVSWLLGLEPADFSAGAFVVDSRHRLSISMLTIKKK